mmetsp:Transcript_153490/g.490722  ORF Transcript_153490/g.490722 Transcript_153490/m.490722 type:complete len:226 (-) Transcript_153490:1088-1765(-)
MARAPGPFALSLRTCMAGGASGLGRCGRERRRCEAWEAPQARPQPGEQHVPGEVGLGHHDMLVLGGCGDAGSVVVDEGRVQCVLRPELPCGPTVRVRPLLAVLRRLPDEDRLRPHLGHQPQEDLAALREDLVSHRRRIHYPVRPPRLVDRLPGRGALQGPENLAPAPHPEAPSRPAGISADAPDGISDVHHLRDLQPVEILHLVRFRHALARLPLVLDPRVGRRG